MPSEGPRVCASSGPVGSRVVAVLAAPLLAAACALFALLALWPQPVGRGTGTARTLLEVVVVALTGVGAVSVLRWAWDPAGPRRRGSGAVVWALGLTPSVLVIAELVRR
jgi:hypothetical protein